MEYHSFPMLIKLSWSFSHGKRQLFFIHNYDTKVMKKLFLTGNLKLEKEIRKKKIMNVVKLKLNEKLNKTL